MDFKGENMAFWGRNIAFKRGSLAFWERNTAFGGKDGFFREQHGFQGGRLCFLPALREPRGRLPFAPQSWEGASPFPEGATTPPWALPSAATPQNAVRDWDRRFLHPQMWHPPHQACPALRGPSRRLAPQGRAPPGEAALWGRSHLPPGRAEPGRALRVAGDGAAASPR